MLSYKMAGIKKPQQIALKLPVSSHSWIDSLHLGDELVWLLHGLIANLHCEYAGLFLCEVAAELMNKKFRRLL